MELPRQRVYPLEHDLMFLLPPFENPGLLSPKKEPVISELVSGHNDTAVVAIETGIKKKQVVLCSGWKKIQKLDHCQGLKILQNVWKCENDFVKISLLLPFLIFYSQKKIAVNLDGTEHLAQKES